MNPDSAAIVDSMGWVLFKLGDYRAALDYLERAYRLEPGPEIGSHLVEVRWQLGERDSARELLRMLVAQYPNDRYVEDISERLDR
jgi:tetratricopeptide (TPR) repeat protein